MLRWRRRELFNKTDNRVWFTTTGFSLSFTECLMAWGGASKTVLGVYCPYSEIYLENLLGYIPEQYVSSKVAMDMCITSRQNFSLNDDDIIISCTASLCKADGERLERVNHAFICVSKGDRHEVTHKDYTYLKTVDLDGDSPRRIQDVYLNGDILDLLFDFVGIEK